jgi:hypothetical protein
MITRPTLSLRRREFLFGAAALAGFQAEAATQPFWDRKPPSEWSASEIDALITSSPWAHPFKASIARTVDDYNPTIPQAPGSQGGGWGIPGAGRVGGLGLPRGRTPGPSRRTVRTQVEGVVRWEDALPIVDALRSPIPEDFNKFLVLSISGIPAYDATARDGFDYDGFRESARLEVDSKVETPELARDCPTVTGATRTLLLGYSRDRVALSETSGNVVFTARVSQAKIRVPFKPREMVYRGKFTA